MKTLTQTFNDIRLTIYEFKKEHPIIFNIFSLFLLSWFYAGCEQIAIPLPFNIVPLILMPVPLYILSLTLGWPAVTAYGLYLIQGALGAPFFAHGLGGIARLLGPTGGYLLGMGLASLFLVITKDLLKHSRLSTLLKIELANVILFASGLFQLSFFVVPEKLFMAGLWPFVIGDFIIKAMVVVGSISKR